MSMKTEKMRRFQVRNIALHAGAFDDEQNLYDVIYHDDLNNCARYSEQVYDTYAEALDAANALENSYAAPTHWDIAH